MAKAKDIRIDNMVTINPVTDNQKRVFKNIRMIKIYSCMVRIGTGKTFITLYLALQEVLRNETKYDCVYLVRSAVPTREIGFLSGDEEDKTSFVPSVHIRIW